MMHNPQDLHSWSRLYREEALREARTRLLDEEAGAGREPGGLQRVSLPWRTALETLLRKARPTEQ